MEIKVKPFRSAKIVVFLLALICCILAGAVLKIASTLILPITFAFLLALTMYPLVKWLDNHRIPHIISIFIVIILLVSCLYVLGLAFFSSGDNISSLYQRYEDRLTEIYIQIAALFHLPYDESLNFLQNLWSQLGIRTFARNFAFSFSGAFLNFITSAGITVLFVVFMLLEAINMKKKLETAFKDHSERINQMTHDLMSQVTRYLTAKFFISLATGLVTAIGLKLIGLEFAIVWGVIAFLLNFIPNLGSIVSGVSTSLFALIQFWPEPIPIILVIILILGVNIIIGSILDPKIIGDHVGISPLMVLISLVLWGYIWGFSGMVLAVPMTVIIKIVCENIPSLESVSILLGTPVKKRTSKTIIRGK